MFLSFVLLSLVANLPSDCATSEPLCIIKSIVGTRLGAIHFSGIPVCILLQAADRKCILALLPVAPVTSGISSSGSSRMSTMSPHPGPWGLVQYRISVRNLSLTQTLRNLVDPEHPFESPYRFENLHQARTWYCCAVCNIRKRTTNNKNPKIQHNLTT